MSAEVIKFPRTRIRNSSNTDLPDVGLITDDDMFIFTDDNEHPIISISSRMKYLDFLEGQLSDDDFISCLKGIINPDYYRGLDAELTTFVNYYFQLDE